MSGFGIYNCDRIYRQVIEPAAVAVRDENGQLFRWHTAYGVLDQENGVVTYWGHGSGENDRMRLGGEIASILFIGKNNELLVVHGVSEQCAGKSRVTLLGTRASTPSSPKELEALVMR
jgi:hypothetical protein